MVRWYQNGGGKPRRNAWEGEMTHHQYGDPCKTCGEPAYDYNVAKCSRCRSRQLAANEGVDAVSDLLFPGARRVLRALREDRETNEG